MSARKNATQGMIDAARNAYPTKLTAMALSAIYYAMREEDPDWKAVCALAEKEVDRGDQPMPSSDELLRLTALDRALRVDRPRYASREETWIDLVYFADKIFAFLVGPIENIELAPVALAARPEGA